MVHSGSRNVGKQIGDVFNDIAGKLNAKWYSNNQSIPFLPVDTLEGSQYLEWMECASKFAYLNRKIIIDDVFAIILQYFPEAKNTTVEGIEKVGLDATSIYDDIVNIHHNVASMENHMGNNVLVHRKGATLARSGTIGIIPGSMETNSFITKGLGSVLSLQSCSHGSGRISGRKEFNVQHQNKVVEIQSRLDAKGIVHSKFQNVKRGRDKGMVDVSETGGAYKDIISVMNFQDDLVTPVITLTPIVSVKG